MTTFFLDLWHDLREKRLWPVAAGLLAAAIAIPAVMLKPATSETPPPPVAAKPAEPNALPAVQVGHDSAHPSRLNTFRERDPFKPMADLKKDDTASSGSGTSTSTSTSSTTTTLKPSSAGASKTSLATPSGSSVGSGGSSPIATTPPSAPSSSGSGDTTTTPAAPLKWFRYTADISFGKPGSMKKMAGVQDFTLLPDDKTAAIVFMGVSNDAKSAIFFVADPAFTASGEGECNDKSDCRFVKLALDDKKDEETFTSLDGSVVYKLKLLKLNREYISPDQAKGDTSDQKSKPGKDAGDPVGKASAMVLPRLLDLGSVGSKRSK